MRYLLLTRGMPFCGKTTWIQKYNLENYTLSVSVFKTFTKSPLLNDSGNICIAGYNDKIAFQMLFTALEIRMSRGDFVIIEDNHISKSYFSNYKEIAKLYAYRIVIVDFSDIPLDTIINRSRALSQSHIDNVYSVEQLQAMYNDMNNLSVPIKCDIIKPDDIKMFLESKPCNLNGYKVIHHIGDIQGSYSVLEKYIGRIKDDEFYIFLGDYIDRGFQNYEVLDFLLTIMDRHNVCLLEGNHEKWLWLWANDRNIDSKEFRLNTQIELEHKGFSKSNAKRLYGKLKTYFYYRFHDKMVICTHGGLSNMPKNPMLLSSSQYIHGVGSYLDTDIIAKSFTQNTPNNFYQFFGHRNKSELPICVHDRNFVMESKVEFGGYLRAIQLNQHGFTDKSIKNNLFISKEEKDLKRNLQKFIISNEKSKKASFVTQDNFSFLYLKKHVKDINESNYPFYPLIVDTKKWQIVGRGYDLTTDKTLLYKTNKEEFFSHLQFPLYAVRKQIGTRIVVSYNNSSFHAFDTYNAKKLDNLPSYLNNKDKQDKISAILKNHSYSFVILQTLVNHNVLLDIFPNDLLALKLSDSNKEEIGRILNIDTRNVYCNIDNIDMLMNFIKSVDEYNLEVARSLQDTNLHLYVLNWSNSLQKQEIFSKQLSLDSNIEYSNDCYDFLNDFIIFDSSGNFFELPLFYGNELQAINHLIKIWCIHGDITKLQWINNAFRELFYTWFIDYSKVNVWHNQPAEWIQNKFLQFMHGLM